MTILRPSDGDPPPGTHPPLSIYDPAGSPDPGRTPFIIGMILGCDREDVERYLETRGW